MTNPPANRSTAISNACAALFELACYLRSERGCPWDRTQNLESMSQYVLEEAQELIDSIKKNDPAGVSEEWGDVFFILLMLAVIAEETGHFETEKAMRLIETKMIRRHPHVFSGSTVSTAEDVIAQWDKIKAQEKSGGADLFAEPTPTDKPAGASLFAQPGPPFSSALKRADHIQRLAAEVGFDWPDRNGVLEKIEEEIGELCEALAKGDAREVGAELGDLLFSCVNLARFVKMDAEALLRATTDKFIERFNYVEAQLRRAGKTPRDSTLAEMDTLWEQSKKRKDTE